MRLGDVSVFQAELRKGACLPLCGKQRRGFLVKNHWTCISRNAAQHDRVEGRGRASSVGKSGKRRSPRSWLSKATIFGLATTTPLLG